MLMAYVSIIVCFILVTNKIGYYTAAKGPESAGRNRDFNKF